MSEKWRWKREKHADTYTHSIYTVLIDETGISVAQTFYVIATKNGCASIFHREKFYTSWTLFSNINVFCVCGCVCVIVVVVCGRNNNRKKKKLFQIFGRSFARSYSWFKFPQVNKLIILYTYSFWLASILRCFCAAFYVFIRKLL